MSVNIDNNKLLIKLSMARNQAQRVTKVYVINGVMATTVTTIEMTDMKD